MESCYLSFQWHGLVVPANCLSGKGAIFLVQIPKAYVTGNYAGRHGKYSV